MSNPDTGSICPFKLKYMFASVFSACRGKEMACSRFKQHNCIWNGASIALPDLAVDLCQGFIGQPLLTSESALYPFQGTPLEGIPCGEVPWKDHLLLRKGLP